MRKKYLWSRVAAVAATVGLTMTVAQVAQAQNTVQAGLLSCINNSGFYTAGTMDNVYVTAVFGTNAYIQDSTGGIYLFKAGSATQGIAGLTIGTQITGLGNGGFYYYTTAQQFEYEPATSSAAFSNTGLLAGTYQSIPAAYYSPMTLSTFNSPDAQGSVTSQGMQNQLVTLSNVTISNAGGTFATGAYTITDASGITGTLYVNAASGVVGTTVPSGSVNVSGVFQNFHGTSELLPRGVFDLNAVPEPGAGVVLGFGLLGLVITLRRGKGVKLLA